MPHAKNTAFFPPEQGTHTVIEILSQTLCCWLCCYHVLLLLTNFLSFFNPTINSQHSSSLEPDQISHDFTVAEGRLPPFGGLPSQVGYNMS